MIKKINLKSTSFTVVRKHRKYYLCIIGFITIAGSGILFSGFRREQNKQVFVPPVSTLNARQSEQRWNIQFNGFFGNGEYPLCVDALELGNSFIAAAGNSIIPGTKKYSFNNCFYWVDMSKVPVKNGLLKGPVQVHLTPNYWVPSRHIGFTADLELEANLKTDGTIIGTYTIVKINTDDPSAQKIGNKGTISGRSKPFTPPILSEPLNITLNLQGALTGASPEYIERCLVVRLGFKNNILISGVSGSLSLLNEIYNLTGFPVKVNDLTYDGNCIKGKLIIPTQTLDLLPCEYTFLIDGRVVDNIVVGSYLMSAKLKDGETINRKGFFDGYRDTVLMATNLADTRPWWLQVKDFQPPKAGEHPRLLFRKSDLPVLRKKAETPEGKVMIANLRRELNGCDGETMPTKYSNAVKAYDSKAETYLPAGTYTFSHVAGYGLLYQLTGDKKYAEMGRQCFELALNGQRDRDNRYSWRAPGGTLRAGPVLGWYAVGYDLCYDGWDESTRERFGKAIENYCEGTEPGDAHAIVDMESLVRGTMPPGSNHYGMQVGGAALGLMAITGESWVDQKRISTFLKISERSMIRNMTEGFGDGGFFAEGDGTGSMSSHIVYLSAIQSWKNAMGMDFVNVERPNVRMTALKWIYLTIVRDGKPDFWPIRGAYGQNVWNRDLSGNGYFGIGYGAVTEKESAAMKWYYNHFLLEPDKKAGISYEAGNYPHISVCAFINWPIDIPEVNPAAILPLCYRDSLHSFFAWRNRWQDENDIVISVLTKPTRGYWGADPDSSLKIAAFGQKFSWGRLNGDVKYWYSSPHGETSSLSLADGNSVAVDFTKTSGAEGMLVTTGKADGRVVKLGTTSLTFKFLTSGKEPALKIVDNKVIAGKQTVTMKNGNIVFAVTSFR